MEERKLICRIAQEIGEGKDIEKIKLLIKDYANSLLLTDPELEDYALHLLAQFSPDAAWTTQTSNIYIEKNHIGGDIN